MVYELVAEAAEAKRCGFQLSAVRFQLSKIGAALPFDCFDCATKWGNNLQGTGRPGGRASRMGFVVSKVPKAGPGTPSFRIWATHLLISAYSVPTKRSFLDTFQIRDAFPS